LHNFLNVLGHDLEGLIISHRFEVAIQLRIGLADGSADVFQRSVVFDLGGVEHLLIALDQCSDCRFPRRSEPGKRIISTEI
jgi:hypothetical protein